MRVYEPLPVALLEALMGLGVCFAGGAYCTSIAAIEAFRNMGGTQVLDSLTRALRRHGSVDSSKVMSPCIVFNLT